jgi:hypothetical protein
VAPSHLDLSLLVFSKKIVLLLLVHGIRVSWRSPNFDHYRKKGVVFMAEPPHYLIHSPSLPFLKRNTMALWNFKLAIKIEILVDLKIKFTNVHLK